MPPDPSFDELIRRVGSGDEEEAARLVRDFEPVVRRVARARLRDGRARSGLTFSSAGTGWGPTRAGEGRTGHHESVY